MDSLRKGIAASFISSSLSDYEVKATEMEAGMYKIVYIA